MRRRRRPTHGSSKPRLKQTVRTRHPRVGSCRSALGFRPAFLEAFLDASDEPWCTALVKRPVPAGIPRLIAFTCKRFSDEATRWSAFEREFYCVKEGDAAIAKYATGCKLFMHFDSKNIERAEAVLQSRRTSNKLVSWVADTQHIVADVVRVWIDGKLNVLADAGSRASWESAVAKHLPAPHLPIRDFIIMLFSSPSELAGEIANRRREQELGPWHPVDLAVPTVGRETCAPEASSHAIDPRAVNFAPAQGAASTSGGSGGAPASPGSVPVSGRGTPTTPEPCAGFPAWSIPVPDDTSMPESQATEEWREIPVPKSTPLLTPRCQSELPRLRRRPPLRRARNVAVENLLLPISDGGWQRLWRSRCRELSSLARATYFGSWRREP